MVFKLDTTGHETILYSFTGGTDGGSPLGGVAVDAAGNIYGTTNFGGSSSGPSAGVIFKLDPYGNETVLHNFACNPSDGCQPHAGHPAGSAIME
jgi:uncharacterized repeat protein (TIGR03803 family)